jgi:hypothetical protein
MERVVFGPKSLREHRQTADPSTALPSGFAPVGMTILLGTRRFYGKKMSARMERREARSRRTSARSLQPIAFASFQPLRAREFLLPKSSFGFGG